MFIIFDKYWIGEIIYLGGVVYSCIWGYLWWVYNGLCNSEENFGSLSLCDY